MPRNVHTQMPLSQMVKLVQVQRLNHNMGKTVSLLVASVELAFEGSSCHFQGSLVGLVPTNEATHMDEHTARDAGFLGQFIISHAPPLLWESLSALESVGCNRDGLHSPAFAPLILQLCGPSQHMYGNLVKQEAC